MSFRSLDPARNDERPHLLALERAGRWGSAIGMFGVGLGAWWTPGGWWTPASYVAGVLLWRWCWGVLTAASSRELPVAASVRLVPGEVRRR